MASIYFRYAYLVLFAWLWPAAVRLVYAQEMAHDEKGAYWHGIQRGLHYRPEGRDFVLVEGKKRFNRALYGTNTAFRVEAGDLPEFALYMPGMGGNLTLALSNGQRSKWLLKADHLVTRYRPGAMLYEIRDELLGKGHLDIEVLPLASGEGMVLRVSSDDVDAGAGLLAVYGGANGDNFSRGGDLGADPESSFYLLPPRCQGNHFSLEKNSFTLDYQNKKRQEQQISGYFSGDPLLKISDAKLLDSPQALWAGEAGEAPVLVGKYDLSRNSEIYLVIQRPDSAYSSSSDLSQLYQQAADRRAKLASRVVLDTPDPYLNTIGGALAVAGDAIWESPSYLHGAVAWRMRLNAWRGAYVADPLGWHDRAREHFRSYVHSQVLQPEQGPVVPDTALHFARHQEKMGTALFSSGYISRNPNDNTKAHHYDMNLVFFDQLFNHLLYTGDLDFAREVWPAIQRHLAWEKRNFDQDGDGLYDAYCAIWASDALQYSGGGVTHTSAYNYRANRMAARLAQLLGEDPLPYEQEATRIKKALYAQLWMPEKGWYAEFKDLLGEKLLHEAPGIWTIYHVLDTDLDDPLKQYQSLSYIDRKIPHIPIQAYGLDTENYYTLSTTNWQPYTWSINNVALAENLQTALAYWQGGRPEEAFLLWKSNLLESMYLGGSPGNFQQLSFYDAQRGELYRDFADPIGVAARTLVEGLFGIQPDLLGDTLTIRPGFPASWDHASLQVPDIFCAFRRTGSVDRYEVIPKYGKGMTLRLCLPMMKAGIKDIRINGKSVSWRSLDHAVGVPQVELFGPASNHYQIDIEWTAEPLEKSAYAISATGARKGTLTLKNAHIKNVYDPQQVLKNFDWKSDHLFTEETGREGMFFVQLAQGESTWWMPIQTLAEPPTSSRLSSIEEAPSGKYEMLDIQAVFNAKLSEIFQQQYLHPRPTSPTLQLPWQGIGNWCYPLINPVIDDTGLKEQARQEGKIELPNGVPLGVSANEERDILFTSQWDNYPKQQQIPLQGKAGHVYFLLAGTTNPMQSQLTNGVLEITYQDGTRDSLLLRNPDNWWPIEQDYEDDGYAFQLPAIKPYRVHLKTGAVVRGGEGTYHSIKGFADRGIAGGAATVLDMPLQAEKELKSLELKSVANDVVIGLMAVTLLR